MPQDKAQEMSNPSNDNHEEILAAFMHEIVAMRNRFADYIAKYEVWDFLSVGEAQFMNEISEACQKFIDTQSINRAKEQKKDN